MSHSILEIVIKCNCVFIWFNRINFVYFIDLIDKFLFSTYITWFTLLSGSLGDIVPFQLNSLISK